MNSSTRAPGRSNRNFSSSGRAAKPKARYLYDEDNDNTSTMSLEESIGDVEGLSGFAMAHFEDEKSEITNKMNNLSSAKYGRKFPKHHSGYRQQQEHYPWHNGRRVRFQEDDETPISALTEDAIASMRYNDWMNFHDAHVLIIDDDSEYPTNSSETRSTVQSSYDDEERQIRLMVRGYASSSCEDDYPSDDVSSIGIMYGRKRPFLTRCLPSIGTMSRWFFLLGCILTLWMAVDSLSWAKEQESQPPSGVFQTGLRRLSTNAIESLRAYTHQEQWNDNANWTHLEKYQQESWSELGFTEERWNDHENVVTDNIEWDKLTEQQQESAEELGFVPLVWDHFNDKNETEAPRLVGPEEQEPPKLEGLIANTLDASASSSRTSPPETSISSEEPNTSTTAPSASNPPPEISTSSEEPNTSTTAPSASNPPPDTNPSSEEPNTPTTAPQASKAPQGKDTVVFTVKGGYTSITKYMVLSFAAALCFLMVGVIEWIQHDLLFQLLLGVAGIWGLLSAMFMERNPNASIAFHTLSVHCFFGAAVAVLWLRWQQPTMPAHSRSSRVANQSQAETLLLADLCFAVGAAMTVVSSYLTLAYGTEQAALIIDIQRFDVFAAVLWVVCAVIYLCCTYKATTYEI